MRPIAGRVRWYTLQVAVSACPLEHATPSCGSDTRGASGAVSDVVGEACDCHCVALVSSSSRLPLPLPPRIEG